MKIAAVERNPLHSPAMVDNDRAILGATARKLMQAGHSVHIMPAPPTNEAYDAIITMTRTAPSLDTLQRLEERGTTILNRPAAVRRCSRLLFTHILLQNNIPQPPHCIIESIGEPPREGYPQWIKRADGWSCHPQDVSFAQSPDEAKEAIEKMRARGIERIICSRHIEGDIIKFYGVSGSGGSSPFFALHHPDANKTKFGLERYNGPCRHHPFDPTYLQATAFAAARAIGLDIFGGDCIVSPDGKIHIIDINDFPSFTAFRDKAAEAIATLTIERVKEKNERTR